MRALVQRVTAASVSIDGEVVGKIDAGLMILLGIGNGDTQAEVDWAASKCVNLRIFADDEGKFNRSLLDVGGQVLVVSQFTLYGDCRKGRRPSFINAAPPEVSEPLYESFVNAVRNEGVHVETGRFGAMMVVDIQNDGPVTLMVERER